MIKIPVNSLNVKRFANPALAYAAGLLQPFFVKNVICEQNKKTWIAGGVLRTLVDQEDKVCDIDVFFSDASVSADVDLYLESHGSNCIFRCPLGELITYKTEVGVKIQLIKVRYYSNPFELINSFDINACRFAFDGDHLYTVKEAIRDVKKKQVSLHNIEFPMATFKRILKYHDKGYKVLNSTIDKYVTTIHSRGERGISIDGKFYVD